MLNTSYYLHHHLCEHGGKSHRNASDHLGEWTDTEIANVCGHRDHEGAASEVRGKYETERTQCPKK